MVDIEEFKRRLRELYGLSWFTDEQVDKVVEYLVRVVHPAVLWDYSGHMASFLAAPASAGHHLAVRGGLAIHSMNVTDRLLQLSKDLKIAWSDSGSPYTIGMCHDLCKMHAYDFKVDDKEIMKLRPVFPGHGTLSAMLAPEFLGHPISYVEQVCIVYHMGAWGIGKDYDAGHLDAAISEFPLEVIATHTADMLASQYDEVGL